MKKIVFALAALASIVMGGNSYAAEEGKWTFGLDFAGGVSWLGVGDNRKVEGDGARLKFSPGLLVYRNFGTENRYSVFSGLNINSYGGWLKGKVDNADIVYKGTTYPGASFSERVRYNFREIEVTVGMRLRTGSYGPWRFSFHLNLGLGLTVLGDAYADDIKINNAVVVEGYEGENFDYSPALLRMTYGVALGTEYDLDFVTLTAKLRYKGSVTNMYFYDHGMFNPGRALNLRVENNYYDKNITFRPSTLEFVIGALF